MHMGADSLIEIANICRESSRPVYALGGITAGRVDDAMVLGAYGVAAIRGLYAETQAIGIVETLHRILDTEASPEG